MNSITMIRNTLLALALLAVIAPSARGELEIKTSIRSLRIYPLLDKGFSSRDVGTQVVLELSSLDEEKGLTGAIIDPSKITFTDSAGNDLFAQGKQARVGGLQSLENMLSVMPPKHIGRGNVKPGRVFLRCHSLATPAVKANGFTIKGEIKVLTESEQTKTGVITKAQLTSGKEFNLEGVAFQFEAYGGGSTNSRSFTTYELGSFAALKNIEVAGKAGEKSPVVIEGNSVNVYDDELTDADQIEISYALPKETTLDLNIHVVLECAGK